MAKDEVKSCFKKTSLDLKGEIVTELMDAETIDLSSQDARAEIGNAILDVFEKYEIPVEGAYYTVEEK